MAESTGGRTRRGHLLLTVLGTKPRDARYAIGKREVEAPLAPLALLKLLPEAERPQRVLAICTPQAKQVTWPLLKEAFSGSCECIDVPAVGEEDHIDGFLDHVVTGAVEAGQDITVDVTHGFRHLSFLTYIAVLYLNAFLGVRVQGAYYGMFEPPHQFLDLRPLLALPRWIHALQVFDETGSTLPMAAAVGQEPPAAKRISKDLADISQAYLSGLPLELGRSGRLFRKQHKRTLGKLLAGQHRLPLADSLAARLDGILKDFALPTDADKANVELTPAELERQAHLVDELFRHDNTATGLGLMNEWTVSWAVWRLGRANWLDHKTTRRSAAGLLGAIAATARDPELRDLLSDDQRKLGAFWAELCELRNAFHHHGMRPQPLVGNPDVDRRLRRIHDYWSGTLRACPSIPLDIGDGRGERLLISPLGRRPGVLYSALHAATDATACLVVCSEESEGLVSQAVERARFKGAVETRRLADPFGGRSEIEDAVAATRRRLAAAESVYVNVTGGTTLMGLVAEGLGDAARRLARPVRRFGLIDRRSEGEQDADPYQVGEPYWLDGAENDDDDD